MRSPQDRTAAELPNAGSIGGAAGFCDLRSGDRATRGPSKPKVRIAAALRSGLRSGIRSVLTLLALAAAAAAVLVIWDYYVTAPWTRDGRVRVQVAGIAPLVSGQIIELRVVDNQFVHKGDELYLVDPFDYQVSLNSAKADLENRAADMQVKQAQAARRAALTTVSTSIEEKQQYSGTAKIAEASFALAQAQVSQAEINLRRTRVTSPVSGYVTNLLLRVGDYATKGQVNISVVDADSYWVDGYFEETKMARVRLGAAAEISLMGYSKPIRGRVDSIARGIATSNAATSTQGLPSVDPVYTWVRLAQRTPVRVRIEAVPVGVPLIAGMTATVSVADPSAPVGGRFERAFTRLGRQLRWSDAGDDLPENAETTTNVRGAATISRLAVPRADAPIRTQDAVPALPMAADTASRRRDGPQGASAKPDAPRSE